MPDDLSASKETQTPINLRLLLILEEVARRGVAVKPTDLIEAMDLPKPTVHRLLQTAESEGFLQRDLDGRSYGLGPRLRSLAYDVMSSAHLRTARVTILRGLADVVDETCNLATPDREGMTYLDRIETSWPLRIQLPIGTQVPFHCTASGKMYLSTLRSSTLEGVLNARPLARSTDKTITSPDAMREELRLIRSRGYATDDQEFMDGMTAIAVPIRDIQNRLIATLSIHAPDQRKPMSELIKFLDPLKNAARKLEQLHSGELEQT